MQTRPAFFAPAREGRSLRRSVKTAAKGEARQGADGLDAVGVSMDRLRAFSLSTVLILSIRLASRGCRHDASLSFRHQDGPSRRRPLEEDQHENSYSHRRFRAQQKRGLFRDGQAPRSLAGIPRSTSFTRRSPRPTASASRPTRKRSTPSTARKRRPSLIRSSTAAGRSLKT